MRSALVFIVLAWPSAPAWARSCAKLLYSRPGLAHVVHELDFDRSGERAVGAQGVRVANLRRLVAHQGLTLVDHPDGGTYGVLFNPDPRSMDKGYVLRGSRVDDRLVVHSFFPSSVHEDRHYYQRVAEVHGVLPKSIKLKRAILKCQSLVMRATTQVKLRLKHRLPIEEVVTFLESSRARPESHRAPYKGKNRFEIEGRDLRGRQLRVVIQDEGACPNGLITAFEVR